LFSWLVPARRRREWLAEWRAELAYAAEQRRTRGVGEARVVWTLRMRALGAASDALWVRRREGRSGMLSFELRHALRLPRRYPGLTTSVVATLALGIAAATTIFSAIDGLLLRPVPFRDPDRLVEVRALRDYASPYVDTEAAVVWHSQPAFAEVRAHSGRSVTLTGRGEPRSLRAGLFEPGVLQLLGAAPLVGRGFVPADAVPGRDRVVLLGEELWRTAFGGAPDVVGESVTLDGASYTVIGVLPPSIRVLPGGLVHLAVPLPTTMLEPSSRWPVHLLARLPGSVGLPAVQSRLDALSAQLAVERPRAAGWRTQLEPLRNVHGGAIRSGLFVLGGAVGLLLLMACANAAGLLFVHGTERAHELAIRRALGGSRGALLRQLLAESAVLTALSGAIGIALSHWGVRILVAITPPARIRWSYTPIELNGRVLAFALIATCATGLLFGLLPAVRSSGARSAATGGRGRTPLRAQRRLRGGIIVFQVALAVILLAGAGLLGRSLLSLEDVDAGYDVDRVLSISVSLPAERYESAGARAAFRARLTDVLRGMPGVEGVSFTMGGVPPEAGFHSEPQLETRDGGVVGSSPPMVLYAHADTAYFSVMGIPVLEGRAFRPDDMAAGATRVVIDPDLARLLWPGTSAVGREFRIGGESPWLTVVGVCSDVLLGGPQQTLGPYAVYYAAGGSTVAVRAALPPELLMNPVREAIWSLDPGVPLILETARDTYGVSLHEPRFLLSLMTGFAAAALLLTAVGIYGLVAYDVTRRVREIGLRMALGARRSRVVGSVFAAGMALALAGLALGIVAALALSRFARGLVFGVPTTDPVTYALVACVLLVACALALLLPSRRAARIDPMEALRVE
jgi:putative ABC transport system permease protein